MLLLSNNSYNKSFIILFDKRKILNTYISFSLIMEEKARTESLDLKDKKILFELDFNARMPYSVLGRKVGLSKQGVEYRVQNLIKRGIIKGFYPVINVPKLGYIYCRLSLTLQNITSEKKKEIVRYLQNNPKVFWLLDVQGIYDIFIVIWAKSLTEFREFIEEVELIGGVNQLVFTAFNKEGEEASQNLTLVYSTEFETKNNE